MQIFSPQLYFLIYLYILLAFTLYYCVRLNAFDNDSLLYGDNRNRMFTLYVFLFVLILGIRPVTSAFGDTVAYARSYNLMKIGLKTINVTDGEWVFNSVMYWFSQHTEITWFFLLVEILYVLPVYFACKRITDNNFSLLLLFFFSSFSFYTYSVNGIRNGLACSLVILAITYIQGDKRDKIICGVLCFLAFNIHRSTALPIAAMIFSLKYINHKNMFYFWFSSIIVSLTIGGAVSGFFSSLGFDDRMNQYTALQQDVGTLSQFAHTGFRWDFLLYSVMPIWLGWYLIFKREIYDKTYLMLLGTYMYSNAFWVMVIRSSFSNRFAYLSWFLYPIVLAYPLLKLEIWPDQSKKMAQILVAHFGFTFLMWMIGKL